MSKRVQTAQAVPARRGLLPRLRNVRIRSKLGLIMLVPVLALVVLAMVRLVDGSQTWLAGDQAYRLMETSEKGAALVHQLQRERALAADYLRDGSDADDALRDQADITDEAIEKYRAQRDRLGEAPETLAGLLDGIDAKLDVLTDDVRDGISESALTMSDAAFQYRIVIDDLITFRQAMAQFAGSPVLADRIRAVASLSEVKEAAAREEIAVLAAISNGGFVSATQRDFISTLTAQEEALLSFASLASDEQRDVLDREVSGEKVQQAATLEIAAARAPLEKQLKISPDEFGDTMGDRLSKLRGVEEALDLDVKSGLQGQRNAIGRQVVAESVVVLLVLFVAVLVALLIARSMARSLRRLREGALSVAYESLPQSVARLRNPETLGELTPDQLASGVEDPVQVRGRDEIGQVSQAFNVVHREAVRIAAEQAALRANVATMFINLARRSQVLVDRLIGNLDRLERGEEDPDRLAQLFQLDHLATRMRRNDENLLVLAGADSSRMQREPAALSDVLRAAQSEVEQYTRIEFGIVDRDVDVAPHAVNDVVHLLAELFDNATSFSPPDTTVVVDARRAGDRTILQIEDRGIGISTEQIADLNIRLASPPSVDVAVSRMMGLVVVGRLATRHGVRVELRAARDRGTIADVILPASVLIMPQRGGRQHTLGLPQTRSPLALESSPNYPPQVSGQQPYGGDPRYDDPRQLPGPWRGGAPAQIPESPSGIPGWGPPPVPGTPAQRPTAAGHSAGGDRFDIGGGGGFTGGNGAGAHLPRRQPGEGITPDGDPAPVNRQHREPQPGGPGPSRPEGPGSGRGSAARPYSGEPQPHGGGFQGDPRGPWTSGESQADAGRQSGPARVDSTLRGEWAPPHAPQNAGRESIHSIELPMGHMSSASPPAPVRRSDRTTPSAQPRSSSASTPANRATGTSRIKPRGPSSSSGRTSTDGNSALITPNADDTMELPIFREVESAWFRTKHPREPSGKGASEEPQGAVVARRATSSAGSVQPAGPPTTPTQRSAGSAPSARVGAGGGGAAGVRPGSSGGAESSWQSAADDGWRRASEAADSAGRGTTDSGLPKRVPMAQLVPGGVDPDVATARNKSPDLNRSPEGVRGLLSAYHRGVQRGRSQSSGTGSGKRVSNDEEQA